MIKFLISICYEVLIFILLLRVWGKSVQYMVVTIIMLREFLCISFLGFTVAVINHIECSPINFKKIPPAEDQEHIKRHS